MINLNLSTATRWGVNAVILLCLVCALYLGHALFIPLVISLLLAALLWPTATWMNYTGIPFPWLRTSKKSGLTPYFARIHIPWGLACLFVVLGLVASVLLVGLLFGLGMSRIVIDMGSYQKQVEVYKDFRVKLSKIDPELLDEEYFPEDAEQSKVFRSVTSGLNPSSQPFINLMLKFAGYSVSFLWQSILIMFILLFLLLEGKMLSRRVVEIFGTTSSTQARAVETLQAIGYQVRAYLVWRTIINFAMAAVLGVLYSVLGLKLAWTWMLLTALLWYIPYIGPMAAGVPPVLDAFVTCELPWVAIGILSFYSVFVVLEGYVVVPVVMGRSMEMNATTVMLACLFWELVWGAPGLFLAMPLMAAVKAVCANVEGWQPFANLMSSHIEEPGEHHPGGVSLKDSGAGDTPRPGGSGNTMMKN